ncbi:iron-containing alcohol dehydrogenase [Endozoicomonas gorgoniicola]|uniref:Iron-containing alcohol dehydrogenase n=1 Tax=Endozoicomonas gorgoniicola TaxID=1234144 RepID=A0ABT3N3U6_9GAMM|nr:iron-containing alcohol dehydrogenase [Endozoicomonas gorgoniicola]MCW7556306.1 iron-containing alcohol dehydrogenase [Endozoicomonas gorgoniicola]
MNNFTFHNPTRIHFGKGQIATIASEIPADARVLITYGGGSIKKNGTLDQVLKALESHTVQMFGGIEPNPTYENLMQAVELARREKIDFLLAVGGGSVIDGTKFIAAAIHFEGDPWTILSEGAELGQVVPAGNVLTLPATGSESNSGSVITRRETSDKLAFLNPLVYPRFAVLDPETTYSLPAGQSANGVVDAFVHIMEQYLTVRDGAHVQDRYAEGLLSTLISEGPKVLKQPEDYQVRSTIMWAANQALNGLIGQGVPHDWATHMIGHEITALHGVDHARTLAIVLPSLMEEMREQKAEKLLQYAARVWDVQQGSEGERISLAISKTRSFFESMGIKTRLSDYGMTQQDIPILVDQLERHGMTALGEKKNITLEVSGKILSNAL